MTQKLSPHKISKMMTLYFGYKEIVAKAASTHQELKQTQEDLLAAAGKLKTTKEGLASIEEQKKLANFIFLALPFQVKTIMILILSVYFLHLFATANKNTTTNLGYCHFITANVASVFLSNLFDCHFYASF